MTNYKVFVNGVFVGVDTLTIEEVKRINNDITISLSKLDQASINRHQAQCVLPILGKGCVYLDN